VCFDQLRRTGILDLARNAPGAPNRISETVRVQVETGKWRTAIGIVN